MSQLIKFFSLQKNSQTDALFFFLMLLLRENHFVVQDKSSQFEFSLKFSPDLSKLVKSQHHTRCLCELWQQTDWLCCGPGQQGESAQVSWRRMSEQRLLGRRSAVRCFSSFYRLNELTPGSVSGHENPSTVDSHTNYAPHVRCVFLLSLHLIQREGFWWFEA